MARTDEQIKKDVTDQLYWDARVDASEVSVEVSNGTVTLRGSVPTYLARTAAFEDSWAVLGVTDVRNQTVVRYPPTITLPTDEEIKTSIENTLARNPNVDIFDVNVIVDAGIVSLEGTVDAYWKKDYAEDLVADIPGVISIDNKLGIVYSQDVTDKIIAEDVIAAIDRNVLVDAEDVNVRVTDGVVTISGTVPTWAARRACYESALYTVGVKSVRNNVAVSSQVPTYA